MKIAEPRADAMPFSMAGSDISRPRMGKMLLDCGKLSASQVDRILRVQHDLGLQFGEAARRLGLLTTEDIQDILSHQFDYPYLSAREGQYSNELVAAYEPFSEQVEALRAVRMQLMLRWFAAGHKSLVIASVDSETGAGVLAANLAVVFSQLGEKTLLVDADLRQPIQQNMFNLSRRDGLSDMLVGRAGLEAIVSLDSFADLSVLTAGTIPPNPQELVCGKVFSDLTATLSNRFDVVLYAVPALSAASDVVAICSRVRGALIVASKTKTRLPDLQEATAQLRQSGAELVGSIMIDT